MPSSVNRAACVTGRLDPDAAEYRAAVWLAGDAVRIRTAGEYETASPP